jgi:hypothetical protein
MVKKQGWKSESERHSLAKKGIKSGSYHYPSSYYGSYEHAYVNENSPEWHEMWKKLGELSMNKEVKDDPTVAENPDSGEMWQYMGTDVRSRLHSFRHRDHPITRKREYVVVPVSEVPASGIIRV